MTFVQANWTGNTGVRGEILYFDDERGVGFITGDDGNRYHFAAADLPPGQRVRKGMRVGFSLEGDRARNIAVEGAAAAPRPVATPEPAPAAPPAPAATSVPPTRATGPAIAAPVPADAGRPGLFGLFRRAITSGYADFRGRARRREYWGFVLWFFLVVAFVTGAGAMIDIALGNMDRDEPLFTGLFAGIIGLALLLPGLAVTVRRIHDIGLSGWFVLLGLIPSIGSLIILVFSLIPSQRHENRWGPPPAGLA